jgi:membrane peptidoglycan carboxypeptidase
MSPARNGRRRLATPRSLTVATGLLLAVSLAACGPAGTGLQRDAARQLQERVLGVTQAAAGNDLAAALSSLDSLESDVAAEVGKGNVSEERRRSIMTAVTAVRADLTAAKAIADAAAAKAAEDAAAQKRAEADATNATSAPVAPAPAEGKGNDSKGKGKNNG